MAFTFDQLRQTGLIRTDNLIDGHWIGGADGTRFAVTDPATGSIIAKVPDSSAADARAATDAAARAFPAWRDTLPAERAAILRRWHAAIVANADALGRLISLEQGKPFAEGRGEVLYGASYVAWFADEATRIYGDLIPQQQRGKRMSAVKEPVGVVAAITPWNFPLAMIARKIAPALAAGCTIIAKPASKTPLTMLYLAKLLEEAGVPAGVVQVLPTGTASNVSAILDDDRLRKFTFTGSTAVGQALAAKAMETSMKVSLELGGNAPFVVLEDGDVDKAVKAVKAAKLRNGGQVCIAPNRFIVHESLAEEFTDGVVAMFRELTVGRGTDEDTELGPLALRDQQETVAKLVDDAIERGATVHCGGKIPQLSDDLADGYFYEPTVLTGFPLEADIVAEEIFGPVVAVTEVSSDEEAIERANDTIFGLAAYVFSENLTRALGAAETIESGMVAVNKGGLSDASAPFGGVKQSGLGREGGFTGIDEFLEDKLISLEG